jgi:hypothetical protein
MIGVELYLRGWTPVSVRPGDGGPTVDWAFLDGIDFDEPFLEQTLERAMRDPFRLLFQRETPLDVLLRVPELVDALPPSGFVFHMSRCGSTLASQMLAATRSTLVVSEAAPLDAIVSANGREEDLVPLVRGMVAALGQPRSAEQRRLVVKLDAWAVVRLPLIRRAFPDVPWVFLFREPGAVLASQLRQRGSRLIPGVLPEEFSGVSSEQALAMPPEEFCARVLARFCGAALDNADELVLFVDYDDLPAAVPDVIAPWFGIDCSPHEREVMLERASRDAKTPTMGFDPRNDALDQRARHAVAEHLAPVHARMVAAAGKRAA